jgi:hypothetical protein
MSLLLRRKIDFAALLPPLSGTPSALNNDHLVAAFAGALTSSSDAGDDATFLLLPPPPGDLPHRRLPDYAILELGRIDALRHIQPSRPFANTEVQSTASICVVYFGQR